MGSLSVLIVTAIAAGGPVGHPNRPLRLADAMVAIERDGAVVASSGFGNLDVALPPGRYDVTATLGPPHVTHARRCQARTVRLSRGTARVHVTLACSVK